MVFLSYSVVVGFVWVLEVVNRWMDGVYLNCRFFLFGGSYT